MNDIRAALRRWPLWTRLAWHDLVQRYHSSFFGTAWIIGNFAILVLVKVAVFGALANTDALYFAAYVAIGFLIWQFMNQIVLDATTVFVAARSWLLGMRMPVSLPVFQATARNVIILAQSALVVAAILAYSGALTPATAPYALLGLAALLLNAVWVGLLLGVMCARFRDLAHLTQSIMRVMFFATPIFWLPSQVGRLAELTLFNPFAHFIEIVRAPLIDGSVPSTSWMIVAAMTAFGWLTALAVYTTRHTRIVKWL